VGGNLNFFSCEGKRGVVFSENMASLGSREDLREQKKEGVATSKALALRKCALVQ